MNHSTKYLFIFYLSPMNIALQIEYKGTNYCGFQSQIGHPTIQMALQEAFEKLLKRKVPLDFAGRTDAGVHATGQVIQFHLLDNEIASGVENYIQPALNQILPTDIMIRSTQVVADEFSARYSCRAREYEYFILIKSHHSPIDFSSALRLPFAINIDRMNEELQAIIGTHDFSSFTNQRKERDHCRRHIFYAKCQRVESAFSHNELWKLRIVGTAFLRGMIRNIVGTLVANERLYRGNKSPLTMKQILEKCSREYGGCTSEAKGLFFRRAYYPRQLLLNKSEDKNYLQSWESTEFHQSS